MRNFVLSVMILKHRELRTEKNFSDVTLVSDDGHHIEALQTLQSWPLPSMFDFFPMILPCKQVYTVLYHTQKDNKP